MCEQFKENGETDSHRRPANLVNHHIPIKVRESEQNDTIRRGDE
jgi:hypothetical protein